MDQKPSADGALPIPNIAVEPDSEGESMHSAPSGYDTPPTEQGTSVAPSTAEQTPGPVRTPFEHAPPSCQPIPRPPLTTDQIAKYESLFEVVKQWETLPTKAAKNSPTAPLVDNERMWLTRECLLRYLRASKWSVHDAARRLQETLVWRREYDVESITGDVVSIESETGKQVILGFDNNARPVLYQNPGKQNTKKSPRQIQHMVFMLERLVDLTGPGQETTALLISFKNATSGGSPSIAQGREVLNILQNHYPERLGKALVSDLPWFINTFFKIISPFIDPVTKEKIAFNEDLRKYVPPSQLDKAVGGEADFEYEHDKYWPALNKLCEKRRAAYRERWEKAGKRLGEYEAYLKGGNQKSLSEEESSGREAGVDSLQEDQAKVRGSETTTTQD